MAAPRGTPLKIPVFRPDIYMTAVPAISMMDDHGMFEHKGMISLRTLALLALILSGPLRADAMPSPVDQTCQRIAHKLSSVSRTECDQARLLPSGAVSVEETPILYKDYPPLQGRTPLGRVLLLGGIHGDEYSSVTITFKWMEILDRFHSGLFHWHFVPLLNPDGLLRRKSQRMNANGVDLNRNFPTPNWQQESEHYWTQRTRRNPRRYPGPAPLSEPESRWLVEEINRFQPDVIVSVHAPHGILDFDGPREAPQRLGSLQLNLLGTYPGSLGNYAGVNRNIPVVTIELPHAGIMPSRSEISRIWVDLVRWLSSNLPARQQQTAPLHAQEHAPDQTEPS